MQITRRDSWRTLFVGFLLAFGFAGCASNGSLTRTSSAKDGGITLAVSTGRWAANPPTLESSVLPVHVSLVNRGSHRLRVSHQEFRIRAAGVEHRPLPPRRLVGREVTVKSDPLLIPQAAGPAFHAAPGRIPALPGFDPWRLPWQDDQNFYTRQYAKWTVSLPTVEMIKLSLPEGVLDPGAEVEGYLYFERPSGRPRHALLAFDLIDAQSGVAFGAIEVAVVRR